MPRELFGDVTHPSISVGNRKWYTVPLSLAAHVSVIVAVVFVSLVAQEFVPIPREVVTFVGTPDLPEPPPAPRPVTTTKTPPSNPDAAPLDAPDGIPPDPGIDRSQFQDPTLGVDVGIVPGGNEVIDSGDTIVAPPPPKPRDAVRPGGSIRTPTKIRDVQPVYPTIALQTRVQGTVILEALLDQYGRVQNLKVLRSYPLLDHAAIDAVRQWEYTPTLLNGVPVPVIMTVTVTFKLQ
jgi:protein TonB